MSAKAGVWSGASLLVPMACDVLLIGNNDRISASTWASTWTDYYQLYLGANPGPLPFATSANTLPVGAHLMWTLPHVFRSGNQARDGDVSFPFAPNRWLVLRLQYPSDGGAPTLSAGVVNSDTLRDRTPHNSDDAQYPKGDGNEPNAIGEYQGLPDWDAPLAPTPYFLSAVGPGTVSWAAAYDNVRNVFAVHDPLQSEAAQYSYMVLGWYCDPNADPTMTMRTDIAQNWLDDLAAKQWSLSEGLDPAMAAAATFANLWGVDTGTPAASLPSQMRDAAMAWLAWRSANGSNEAPPAYPVQSLCHSLIATVDWQGSAMAYGTGAPGEGTSYPMVAMGNTAAEAVSAYMAKQVVDHYQQDPEDIPVIERAMEAFQLGLLNQLSKDVVGTESSIQSARFRRARGGSEWIVVHAENDPKRDAGDSPNKQMIALTDEQTRYLIALNDTQEQLDQLNAMLDSQRGELGALIYKTNSLKRSTPNWLKTKVTNALIAMSAEVEANTSQGAEIGEQVTTLTQQLSAKLGETFVVKSVARQPYTSATDPVVLVAGASLDTKLAAPGTFASSDTLRVRFTGETVSGLQVDFAIGSDTKTATLTAAELLGSGQIVLPTNGAIPNVLAGLPKETADLLVECVLLDPNAAPLLAKLWFAKLSVVPTAQQSADLTKRIETEQKALWSLSNETIAQGATGFMGVVPSSAAVSIRMGQPWTPIYVDWQVRWIPNAGSTAPLAKQLEGWSLDEYDFEWSGTLDPSLAQDFIGRAVVGADTALSLEDKFKTFEDNPDYANLPLYIRDDLERVAALIGNADMLAQSLTGLSKELATREQAMMQLVAINGVSTDQIESVGQGPWTFKPSLGSVDPNPPVGPNDPNLPFFPVRSGHFQLMKLWVVDSFGQILVGQNPQLDGNPIQVVLNSSMKTAGAGNEYVAQLPPRINQGTRAELRMISATDDRQATNSAVSTSPICGWIMVNYLDQSLMVFDAAGNNQGSVLRIQRDTANQPGLGLRWEAVPGSSVPLGSSPQLAPHLQGFVTTLINRGTSGDNSFGDLLDIIDATIYRLRATGALSSQSNLGVLLGQPFAVVRARLEFELDGAPDNYQWWAVTGDGYVDTSSGTPVYKAKPAPINELSLGFRVGDLSYPQNGVVGYFIGDDYSTIYSAHSCTPPAGISAAMRATPHVFAVSTLGAQASPPSNYVVANNLIKLAPGAAPVYLTLLLAPSFQIPLVAGGQPVQLYALPNGATGTALDNMTATFRVGPILLNPSSVSMPLPSQIRGKWGWAARTDVTQWATTDTIARQDNAVLLSNSPPTLSEGWLTLSGAIKGRS